MVKTHAGTESENAITSALVELSGELEGESGFPIGQAEPQLGGAQGEEHLVQRGLLGGRFNKSKAALVAELVEDEASSMAPLEQIPENDNLGPGEDSCEEVDLPSDVLHVEHEALALQFKAKQKMAEARKMRSFFKKDNNGSRKPKDEQMTETSRALRAVSLGIGLGNARRWKQRWVGAIRSSWRALWRSLQIHHKNGIF